MSHIPKEFAEHIKKAAEKYNDIDKATEMLEKWLQNLGTVYTKWVKDRVYDHLRILIGQARGAGNLKAKQLAPVFANPNTPPQRSLAKSLASVHTAGFLNSLRMHGYTLSECTSEDLSDIIDKEKRNRDGRSANIEFCEAMKKLLRSPTAVLGQVVSDEVAAAVRVKIDEAYGLPHINRDFGWDEEEDAA